MLLEKLVSGIMLTLLLASAVMLAYNIQLAEATQTIITIKSDGSIDQPTPPVIETADKVTYVFIRDINYTSIVVEKPHIIVDGNGHSMENSSEIRVTGTGMTNVTIRHVNMSNCYSILLQDCTFCNVTGNYLNSTWGIDLEGSSFCNVTDNYLANGSYGIYLRYSSFNTLKNNSMVNNTANFCVDGGNIQHFLNDVDASNTVDDRPICYWINEHGGVVTGDVYGCVVLVNCTDMSVYNLNLSRNLVGVQLVNTNGSTIIDNKITANPGWGIGLFFSSCKNEIAGNNITANGHGIYLVESSILNTISYNNITNNFGWGIQLYKSGANLIYHNRFINNGGGEGPQAWADVPNAWDTYGIEDPPEGNLWSNYVGPGPYHISYGNDDHYPIIGVLDIAIIDIALLKTVVWVGSSYVLPINVTVKNLGEHNQTFNVEVRINSSPDLIQPCSLPSGTFTSLYFQWDTSGRAKGNYTISASLTDIVPDDTNITNNDLTDGWVIIAMIGDLTGKGGWPDGKVNMEDIGSVARLFGVNYPDPRYNPNFDIDSDGRINMVDVGTVARHFGETDP